MLHDCASTENILSLREDQKPALERNRVKGITLLLTTLIATRLLFIWLMPATYSVDLHSWLRVIDVLQAGQNPYDATNVLNWPPFWMEMLAGIGAVSRFLHLSAIHLIQCTLISCECVVALFSYLILEKFFKVIKPENLLIPFLAINPIPVFQVCQHCNFDVFVALWVVLMAYHLLHFQVTQLPKYWLLACFCMGMGIFTKTVPVVLAPLLFPGFARMDKRIRTAGIILAFAPVTLAMALLYGAAPAGVMEHVIGYRSMPGYYGITGIMGWIDARNAMIAYLNISPVIILFFMVWVALNTWKSELVDPQRVLVPALALLVFLPTFGPGYSPTYIYWFLPLLAFYYQSSKGLLRRFLLIGLLVVVFTYIYEYSIFNSHGAFLVAMIPGQAFRETTENLGGRLAQVPARMPMFLFFCILNLLLVLQISGWARQTSIRS